MRKLTNVYLLQILFFTGISLVSCNTSHDTPLPENQPGEMTPVSKPLKFSVSRQINWITISPDSIKPPKSIPFNFNKLPVKPFVLNDFKPFTSPVQSVKLDWDNLPDSLIQLDTIPEKPFVLAQSVLPKPVITKAGIPKILPGTTAGILQFSEEEGLPSVEVTASLMDRSGAMWVANLRTLSKYTGDQLFTWSFMGRAADVDAPIILHIMEDRAGRIWVTTSGEGVYVLDLKRNVLLSYKDRNILVNVLEDHEGNIWISKLIGGLLFINTQKSTIKDIMMATDPVNGNAASVLKEDRNHNIWIGRSIQVSVIDSSRNKIKNLGAKAGINVRFVIELFEDSKGDMWVGSFNSGLQKISLKDKTLTTISKQNGFTAIAMEIEEDKDGKLWVSKNDSVFVINPQITAFKTIVTNGEVFFKHKTFIEKDNNGVLWVGTIDKGVLIIDPLGPLAEHINSKNGLADDNIWANFEDDAGNIWIGTKKGINIYSPDKNELRLLSTAQGLKSNDIKAISKYGDDEIFIGTGIGYCIINIKENTITNYSIEQGLKYIIWNRERDRMGNEWLPSAPYIFMYNPQTKVLKKAGYKEGMLAELVYEIKADPKGNLWATTDSGMMIIDPATNAIKYLRKKEGLCSDVAQKILIAKDGDIWVGTSTGISVVNIEKNTITNLTADEGLRPADIFELVEQDNNIFAGSNNGLIVIEKPDSTSGTEKKNNKWRFANYGKREGFPFNDYNQMSALVRKDGQLWLGVTPFLTILTQKVKSDTVIPNVQITGINIQDRTSYYEWNESKRKVKEDSAKIVSTTSSISGQQNDSGYFAKSKIRFDSLEGFFNIPVGLELPYNQNSMNFSFTNNAIKGRDKMVYRYILEGVDDNWSDLTEKPFTRNYFNIEPGHYTFKVATKGFNGRWSSPATISFAIHPPWWKTWWAYILYALIFGGAAWIFALYRSRWLKEENRVLEEKVNQRTAELNQSMQELRNTQSQLVQSEKMASLGELTAGIAHEIQNPLNFINNFSEVSYELLDEMKAELSNNNREDAMAIAEDVKQNLEKVIHHGRRADSIVKGMLQHSRGNSGVREPVDINALADEYLRLSYQGLRAKDNSFNASFKTEFDPSIKTVNIIPQDIGRVLLNLYNNAFYAVASRKKAQADFHPEVTVSTRRKNDKIEIVVKDNGDGIPQKIMDKVFQPFFTTKPTGQGTGLGLSLSYDIIKAHGGEIRVNTKESIGTEFIIVLPVA